MAEGGVCVAGGIVPKFREFIKVSEFRAAFEDKGRFAAFLRKIPVYLITHEYPGLIGSGTYLKQKLALEDPVHHSATRHSSLHNMMSRE